MMIEAPIHENGSQGTIFSCAYSDAYKSTNVYGLIITARCDLAQTKATSISYLPIVSIDDWMLIDGYNIFLQRLISEYLGKLKSVLRDANLSTTLLETINLDDISKFLNQQTGKTSKALAKRFDDALHLYKQYNTLSAETPKLAQIKSVIKDNKKQAQLLIKELLDNKLADYHYIDRCQFDEECAGYVAIMREIHSIPQLLFGHILLGLDKSQFNEFVRNNGEYRYKMSFKFEDIALPLGTVKSPFIEHIMQRFTMLYARIGVKDHAHDAIGTIFATAPIFLENAQ
jgi:hypothetical protein